MASSDIVWITYLLFKIGFQVPYLIILYLDNKWATQLAVDSIYHARTKHIKVSYHFVRDLVTNNILCVLFIPSKSQVADLFTKGLLPISYHKFCSNLLWLPPHQLARV